jgi:hypothetical protein
MKRKIKIVFRWLPVFVGLFYFSQPALGFTPLWKAGDTWTVAISYVRAFGSQKWSEPMYWKYSVSSDTGSKEQPGLILEARDKTDNFLGLRMRLSSDLVPVNVQTFRKIRGRQLMTETKPASGFPLLVTHTLAAFDFPVFPLKAPSSKTFAGIQTLSRTSSLRMPKILKQENCWVGTIPEIYGVELETNSRELIEVKVLSQDNDILFFQYWDKSLPWPLYGENKNMKYWLVQE